MVLCHIIHIAVCVQFSRDILCTKSKAFIEGGVKVNKQAEIGARLRKLREDRGLKQRELADHLGLTAAGYGKMETGERGLSSEYCIALADYYGTTCDYILRGIEAEYVDVCTRTGLRREALDVLEQRERALRQVQGVRKFYEEQAESDRDEKFGTYNFVLNAMITAPDFLSSIANQAQEALMNARRLFHCDQIMAGEIEAVSNELYHRPEFFTGLNSAKYVAGNEFSHFFDSIWKDAEFAKAANAIEPLAAPDVDGEAYKTWLETH